MKPTIDHAIQLLHSAAFGTLATHSAHAPGYPYASALPFVTDQRHHPVFLISGLAEHTRNLEADARTSFLVANTDGQSVVTGARVTLVGDTQPVEASQKLAARYLRYHPDAQQFLALADFAFFELAPKRARYIAGFGQMGWLEEAAWAAAAALPLADEENIIHECVPDQGRGVRLLGIDCYGVDLESKGKRERQRFPRPLTAPEQIAESVSRLLRSL